MARARCVLYHIVLFYLIQHINAQGDRKISLTFVIDKTKSMERVINTVEESAFDIFTAVHQSHESYIENFVLVTFADPEVDDAFVTTNEDDFKDALHFNLVDGNDCPEYVMTGIQEAIEASNPGSTIYVFTDASAKDYKKIELVKDKAINKRSQVVFILTGKCDIKTTNESIEYDVYGQLAQTSGQVFNLHENNITEILKYVSDNVQSRKIILLSADEPLPPGVHKLNYTADTSATNTTISTSGVANVKNVTGPNGEPAVLKPMVGLDSVTVAKVYEKVPGLHTIVIDCKSNCSLVVTAKSDIQFLHGFSTFIPSSLNDTTVKPIADKLSYLTIELVGKANFQPQSAKFVDVKDNELDEMSLRALDFTRKLYITKQLRPPSFMFRIIITGLNLDTNETVTRIGTTLIEPQIWFKEDAISIIPIITIEGAPKIIVELGSLQKLNCLVNAYPPPKITWKNKETGKYLSSSEYTRAFTFYISIFEIENVINNSTYICIAENENGVTKKSVTIETKPVPYFNVEGPKDVIIEYNKTGHAICKVDAVPPAKITWYKEDKLLSKEFGIDISSNNSILFIQHMQPNQSGSYVCEVTNDKQTKRFQFKVDISGVEAPLFDKPIQTSIVKEGTSANISCRIRQGKPYPKITWFYENKVTGENIEIKKAKNKESYLFTEVNRNDPDKYVCLAENIMGLNRKIINTVVEYPPTIDHNKTTTESALRGHKIRLSCVVHGVPLPEIVWTKDDTILTDIHLDHSISFKVNQGTYKCNATNKWGSATKIVNVEVAIIPRVSVTGNTTIDAEYNKPLNITCKVVGYPKPDILWQDVSRKRTKKLMKTNTKDVNTSEFISILSIENVKENSTYQCKATNIHGRNEKKVIVQTIKTVLPKIRKTSTSLLYLTEGGSQDLSCRIEEGIPIPTIQWYFQKKNDLQFSKLDGATYTPLKFPSLSRNDRGLYKCVATNEVGNDTLEINIVVEYPPSIKNDIGTRTVTKKEGENVTFSCLADGFPNPEVRWTKNDKPLPDLTFSSSSDLTFKATLNDTGVYKCIATNKLGTTNMTLRIEVTSPPIVRIEGGKNIDVEYDKTLYLKCMVSGYPKPDVSWEDVSSGEILAAVIEESNPHSITSTLKIARVKENSKYKCKGSNTFGNHAQEVNVIITEFFDIKNFPEDKIYIVKYYEPVKFVCEVHAYPPADISWYLDRRMIATGTILNIEQMQRADEGKYICEVKQRHEISTIFPFEVKAIDKPKLIKWNENIFVLEGKSTEINCRIEKGIPEPSIQWYFKDMLRPYVEITEARNETTLSLRHLNRRDRGTFKCFVENDLGNDSMETNLVIEYPPTIKNDKEAYIATLDKSITIPCLVDGVPKPVVQWRKDGYRITNKYPQTIISEDSLTISDFSEDDVGEYECRAKNKYNTAHRHVQVYTLKIKPAKNQTITILENNTLKLRCRGDGKPKPRIQWMYQSYDPKVSLRKVKLTEHSVGKYEIENIQYEQRGSYICIVSNHLGGRKSTTTTVEVKSKPRVTIKKDGIEIKNTDSIIVGEGDPAVKIYCDVSGYPKPKITWERNNENIPFYDNVTTYILIQDVSSKDNGVKYKCTANNFDTDYSYFSLKVVSECLLKIDPENKHQPLILEKSWQWPTRKYEDGFLSIPKLTTMLLSCQSASNYFIDSNVYAKCDKYARIKIYDNLYNSDMKCNDEIKPRVKITKDSCFGEDWNIIKIEFKLFRKSVEVYEICFDFLNGIPVYSKHKMNPPIADSVPKDVEWIHDNILNFTVANMYDENIQKNTLASLLGRWFHKSDRCMFSKRQLVNPLDVFPGAPQRATFTYLNVVPHWSCTKNNWDEVESRVRKLSKSKDDTLIVWTGTAKELTLKDTSNIPTNIFIYDNKRTQQSVSSYIWKVVQHRASRSSLAIVQLNIPDVTTSEIHKFYRPRRDICRKTAWMRGGPWRDTARGFVFCYELRDFVAFFGFQDTFENYMDNILYN